LLALVVVKLLLELSVFAHLRRQQHTPHKRSALLLRDQLGMTTLRRFFFGVIGGVVLPLVLLAEATIASHGYHPWFVGALTLLILGLLTVGELLERFLFFAASVAPRMPGAPVA